MCRTYNTIGSLTAVKSHLEANHIHDFRSLKEVIDFHTLYTINRQQLIAHHENLIKQEKEKLTTDLQHIDYTIEREKQQEEQRLTSEIDKLKQQLSASINQIPINRFQKITNCLRQLYYKWKLIYKERTYDYKIFKSIKNLVALRQIKDKRFQFIDSQFSMAVEQSSQGELWEFDRKKSVIDDLSSCIYGAFGEQKVAEILETLSDDYILINDFAVSFSPAIYNRKENDYIKSIQIDHLLVAPSGIFLIETKNWSEKSLENSNLRSPVQQIRRTSYALFMLLNGNMSNLHLRLDKHHWGDKKIPIRNLIVFIKTKPSEEFQYVKVLTLNELPHYINYFKPIFSSSETQIIASYLVRLME